MSAMKEYCIDRAETMMHAIERVYTEESAFLRSLPVDHSEDLALFRTNYAKACVMLENDIFEFMEFFGELFIMLDNAPADLHLTLLDYLFDGVIA